jgi:hypothetical protein
VRATAARACVYSKPDTRVGRPPCGQPSPPPLRRGPNCRRLFPATSCPFRKEGPTGSSTLGFVVQPRRKRLQIGPDISAPVAASLADEPRVNIGQSQVVGPAVTANRNRVAAVVVRAIDCERARRCRAFRRGVIICWRARADMPNEVVASEAATLGMPHDT